MTASVTTFVPLRLARRGAPLVDTTQRKPAPPLLRAIGLALYWQQQLDDGVYASLTELAQREGLNLSTVSRVLQIGRMAPDLVETCLSGQQPRTLTLKWLQRHRLPNGWAAQRQIFSTFA
jgi:hypothetical protein